MSFEAAFDFSRCLAFGRPPGGVMLGLDVVGEAGEGDRVQSAVELAVAAAVEPVADELSGGCRDRGGTGEGGEGGFGAEAAVV